MRQIEVAELMNAAANFSVLYVKALLAATASAMLVDSGKARAVAAITPGVHIRFWVRSGGHVHRG